MNAPTVRYYAQTTIFDNYSLYVNKLLAKYSSFFEILPASKLDGKFSPNDISILMIREIDVHKQSQSSWFMKTTQNVRKNTKKKILIIVFSDTKDGDKRKTLYQQQIPNSCIVYFDFEDWFPINTDDYFNRHYKNLHLLDKTIADFMTLILSDLYMY